jgi:RNA polymerase sigma factor (sigma-70 family)
MKQMDRHRWDDRELVSAMLSGDRSAGDVLFARYDSYSQRIALRYTSSPDAAAEAVAAGKALAFEKLETLRDPDRFGAWMATIVRNSAATAQRQQSREVPHAEVPEVQQTDASEDSSINSDRLRRARQALLSLSVRDRKALELSVYERLPVTEVAATLMIDVNTAYQVLSRARKRARRAYLTPTVPDDASIACKNCAAKTPDYIRGLQNVRTKVDSHVETCAACRARLAEMLAESIQIKGLFSIAPLGLIAGLHTIATRALPKVPAHVLIAGAAVSTVAVMTGATGIYLRGHNPGASARKSTALGTAKGGVTGGSADTSHKTVTSPLAGSGAASPAPPVASRPATGTSPSPRSKVGPTVPPLTLAASDSPPSSPHSVTSTSSPTTKPTTATTTTTTKPTPEVTSVAGTLLTGNGTATDQNGNANAFWSGSPAYNPGPKSGTESFGFNGGNGLTDPGLAQLGGANFTISFDLKTDQQMIGSGSVDLLGYRPTCDSGEFFDIRLGSSAGPGKVWVELYANSSTAVLASTAAVNDGTWHQITITRVGTDLTLSVDGTIESTTALPAGASIENSADWQVADGDPCIGEDGTTALIGSMANIYVGPNADPQQIDALMP